MNKKDAQAALESGTLVGFKRDQYDRTVPVKVIAVGVARRVYTSARADFRGHNASDGVEIEYTEGTKAGCREIVGARTIRELAAAQGAEQAAEAARRAESMRIERARLDCEAAVDRLNAAAGAHLASVQSILSHRGYGITGYRIVIGPAAANRLAAAIEAGDA